MKITKEQLKNIIKEEIGTVLQEMGPEMPGEELPQGAELEQALDVPEEVSPEVEEMNQWFAANPNASTDEIRRMWNEITHTHRTMSVGG